MRTGMAVLLVGIIVLGGILPSGGHAGAAESATAHDVLRIGLALQPTNALVIIALNQKYFADQRLNVVVTEYPSGKIALGNGLFAGKVDLVTVSDVPIAVSAFKRQDFKVIASVYTVDNQNRVIARKDRGINSPSDLRGKRLATQRGSAVHFFLSLFLANQGITENQVELSFMAAGQLPEALAGGEIDAFSMREPFISRAQALVGDNAVVFDAPGLYDQTDQIVVSDAFMAKRPDAAVKIVRALVRAEEYVGANPGQAQKIIAARLDVPTARIAASWPQKPPRVSLQQSLLSRLEAQARWALRRDLAPGRRVPNYLEVIHLHALAAVKPRAVTVVR